MNVLALSLTVILTLVFAGAGVLKLVVPKNVLYDRSLTWVEASSAASVKTIGALELLGALGLVLPWWLQTLRVLTPVAAAALCFVMICAFVVHLRRHESTQLPPPAVLAILCATLACLRFAQL